MYLTHFDILEILADSTALLHFLKKNAQRASTGFVISFNPPPKEMNVPT